jgi:Domain of unknown function (DUF4384)
MKNIHRIAALLLVTATAFAQQIKIVDGDSPEDQNTHPPTIQASVMLQDVRQAYREAFPDDVFFDGQRFRLNVSSARSGYLYILCENSQGSATVLFPNDPDKPANYVRQSRQVTVPGKSWFQFDEEPGIERVYLVLSANPIAPLDRAARRGGEISAELIESFVQPAPAQERGITLADDGVIAVRKIELRHEPRNAGR